MFVIKTDIKNLAYLFWKRFDFKDADVNFFVLKIQVFKIYKKIPLYSERTCGKHL